MNPSVDLGLDQLHLIEPGDMPRVETAILRDRLARGPEQGPCLADVIAYKHRLHALRCENFSLRLHIHNLETQLNQMRATRGWKMLEKFRWWRRTLSGWLQHGAEPRP
jgi:hypothetical protein